MTTPDFPDWATPVATVEDVQAVAIPGNQLNPNVGQASFDSSRYASIGLALTTPNPGGVKRYAVTAQWMHGVAELARDVLTFHGSSAAATYPNVLSWQLPVRGPSCLLTAVGDDNSAIAATVIGSTRNVAQAELTNNGPNASRLLLAQTFAGVAAGAATATVYVPPVCRRLLIRASATTGLVMASASGVNNQNGALAATVQGRFYSGNNDTVTDYLDAPGVGTEWTLTNKGTGAQTLSLAVWDVS